MAETICQVAVNVAKYIIDKPYDYRIPKPLIEDVSVGVRVMIPFGKGNKQTEGIVLSVSQKDDIEGLKAISLVLDDEPVLDEKMLKLAIYMRERLFCTIFECIKAMLPVGLWFDYTEEYSICDNLDLLEYQRISQSKTLEGKILSLFSSERPVVSKKDILSFVGGKAINKQLNALCEKGMLCYSSDIKKKANDKMIKMVRLIIPYEEAMERAQKGRSAVRIDIVSCLSGEGSMSITDLCYMTGASKSVVNTMVKNGILDIYEEETFRTPDVIAPENYNPVFLTNEQQTVFDGINGLLQSDEAKASLLFGVTGSGKTQIYIKLIEECRNNNKSAILLVPEIGLTPQVITKFIAHFGDEIAVLHSALSAGERYDSWKKIKRGTAKVVIGTRSAVFAPVQNLGIIIIDEEQDDAYKSENTPRYHTRDIAKYRVFQNNALLVLGSATPSIESYYGAQNGKYPIFELSERYTGSGMPEVKIADMRGIIRDGYVGSIGKILYNELAQNLSDGKQSILFINRRGDSRMVSCAICGWTPECEHCSVSMTYHSMNYRLMCHYCGDSYKLPTVCPECGSTHIQTSAFGTQRVERELTELFPNARILRMDADTTSTKNSHQKMLDTFAKGKADILLGTQMVTKGLDFENVTLVGVLDADQSLFAQDYKARERVFSLITQVVGRAGRRFTKGRAIIQTYNPENKILLMAARQDYKSFYESEIEIREALMHPPATQILMLNATGEVEHMVVNSLLRLKARLEWLMDREFSDFKHNILGPAPASIVRINRRYRYHLLIRCPDTKRRRQLISGILREFSKDKNNFGVTLYADINPQDL